MRTPKTKKSAPTRATDLGVTVIASIAIAIPLMFYLHQHVKILQHNYEIESLVERRDALAERTLELRMKRMQAASLPRVEEQAARAGLEAPPPSRVWRATGTVPAPSGTPAIAMGGPTATDRDESATVSAGSATLLAAQRE